jgi:AraC-like DNA-binding protein
LSVRQDIPAWIATGTNVRRFRGMSVLYGGPQQAVLSEHAHAEVQLSVHLPADRAPDRGSWRASLYASYQPHSGGWAEGVEVVVFHLSPGLLHEVCDDMSCGAAKLLPKRGFRDPVVEGLAALCNSEHKHPHTLSTFHIELATHLLVQHLLRNYSSSPAVAEIPEAFSSRELSRISSFIEGNIQRGFSAGELAAWMGTTPARLSQRLRRSTGLSAWGFVQKHRIAMAKLLLRNHALTIADISARLGYFDQSHFTKAFRAATGLTPGSFRE